MINKQDVEQVRIDFEISEKLIKDRSAKLIQRSNELIIHFLDTWDKGDNVVVFYRKNNPKY
jgi:hypothetical protein